MSDRLDIVRLIDAKVTASRRTVIRSKQLAEVAKDDLNTHEEWLGRHRRQAEEEREKYQRRLRRRRRLQGCKRLVLSVVLFVPSLVVGLYRGVAGGLGALDRLAWTACVSIGRSLYAAGRWILLSIAGTVAWIARQLFTMGLWMAAAFWLVLSSLGAVTRHAGVSAFGAGTNGLSWLAPRSRDLSRAAAGQLSSGFSQGAILTRSFGLWIERHIKERAERRQQDRRRPTIRQEPSLDAQRLQDAAYVRLRAEHARLQARIHAMDRHFGSRVSAGGHPDGAEWAELRQLAVNARRLFEVQQAHALQSAAPRGDRELRPSQEHGAGQTKRAHPLRPGPDVRAPAVAASTGQVIRRRRRRPPLRLRPS